MSQSNNKNSNSGTIKIFGAVALLFGIVYAILGTLALTGAVSGLLPGHEAQEALVVVLAYAVAILAIICGAACIKGVYSVCRALGLVFAVLGLVSLIYLQITQDSFSIADCIALVLGAAIYGIARKEN